MTRSNPRVQRTVEKGASRAALVLALCAFPFSSSCATMTNGSTDESSTAEASTAVASAVESASPMSSMAPSSNDCGPIQGQLLREPDEIMAVNGVLDTSLVVADHEYKCVPIWSDEQEKWVWDSVTLRTYFHPKDPSQPIDPDKLTNLVPSIPGPTLVLRKPAVPSKTGDRLRLKLYNRLPNTTRPAHDCEPAEFNFRCKGTGTACNPAGTTDPCAQCENGYEADPLAQISPQCFHGPEVTNIHYHGSHVSPQEHQDFVLLKLFSSNQTFPDPRKYCKEGNPECAFGSYQTDIDPLTYGQAPGTHWYHPHKHGSTALQVINGMAGAMIIKGPFDDWLENYYSSEKVLVVHQIAEELPFFLPGSTQPKALVNGQLNPKIEMYPGEIQRWRFVGATMQASGSLDIGFDEGPKQIEHRQVAQDGVQFSRENYAKQPFTPHDEEGFRFQLAPGNRVDFLVKAPRTPGDYFVTHRVAAELGDNAAAIHEKAEAAILRAFVKLNPKEAAQPVPSLLQITVVPGPTRPVDFPKVEDWPDMPPYLENIPYSEATIRKELTFGMTGGPAVQPNCFYVGKGDGELARAQYKDGCAFETLTLGQAEIWKVTNNNSPNHPFHIHVNPFQLLEEKGAFDNRVVHDVYDPPIWMDTISIPGGNTEFTLKRGIDDIPQDQCNPTDSGDLCPDADGYATIYWQANRNRCRCKVNADGYIRIVQKPKDFTGPFVIHCHFLGHEDRGMMQNVQAVCPNGKYGVPAAGLPNECRDGNYLPSLDVCTGNDTCPTPDPSK